MGWAQKLIDSRNRSVREPLRAQVLDVEGPRARTIEELDTR